MDGMALRGLEERATEGGLRGIGKGANAGDDVAEVASLPWEHFPISTVGEINSC